MANLFHCHSDWKYKRGKLGCARDKKCTNVWNNVRMKPMEAWIMPVILFDEYDTFPVFSGEVHMHCFPLLKMLIYWHNEKAVCTKIYKWNKIFLWEYQLIETLGNSEFNQKCITAVIGYKCSLSLSLSRKYSNGCLQNAETYRKFYVDTSMHCNAQKLNGAIVIHTEVREDLLWDYEYSELTNGELHQKGWIEWKDDKWHKCSVILSLRNSIFFQWKCGVCVRRTQYNT